MHQIRFPLGELTAKSPDPLYRQGRPLYRNMHGQLDMDAPSAAYLLEKKQGEAKILHYFHESWEKKD